MLEQEVTARSEDAPKPRRARAEARESGTAEIADWRSFRVFNLKLRRPTLRLTDHLTAETRSIAHAYVCNRRLQSAMAIALSRWRSHDQAPI